MKLLDLEFERAIKDLSNKAIEELRVALKNARWNRSGVLYQCLNTDELTKEVNQIRQKYGLDATTEMDDDKAIEAIEDPIEKRRVMQQRGTIPGKKMPVRLLSKKGMEDVLNKEIQARKVAKYAKELQNLSRDDIENLWTKLFDEYHPIEEDHRSNSAESSRRRIDPRYGINYYDKINAIDRVRAVIALRDSFAKCSRGEFKDIRDKIENLDRTGQLYNLHGEVGIASDMLGINISFQGELTMADFAQVIEDREKEFAKGISFTMSDIGINGLNRGVTTDTIARGTKFERSSRNTERNNDGVIK